MSIISDRDIIVCTSATEPRGLFADLQRDLSTAGIPHHHIVSAPRPAGGSGNLGGKLTGLRALATGEWLPSGIPYKRIIVCDAWDIMYVGGAGAGSMDELIAKVPLDSVVIAADRDPWPDGNPHALHAQSPPPNSDSPWCWCNGGFIAGGSNAILQWCDWVENSPGYSTLLINQQFMNWQLLLGRGAGPPSTIHDTRTELCYCMAREFGELRVMVQDPGTTGTGLVRPVNTLFGTKPMFLHFNGRLSAEPYKEMVSAAERLSRNMVVYRGVIS